MFSKRKEKKKNNKLNKDGVGLPPLPSARTKASFGLEEKLLHLWRTPITQLPVYKDLPRLIRRIEVVVNEPETVKESPRQGSAEPQVHREEFEVWLNNSLPDDENRFRARAWNDQWSTVTLSIVVDDKAKPSSRTSHIPFVDVREAGNLLYSVPISQVFTVSDSTRYFVIQSLSGEREDYAGIAFNMRTDSTAFLSALEDYGREREALEQALGTITAPPSVDRATLRFLNKLGVSQRDLQDPETANMLFRSTENFLKSTEEKKSNDDALSQLEVMQQVITHVARHMEDRSKLEEITNGLRDMVASNYKGDMELMTGSLFAKSIGQDSKTARVFKMINQSVIFIPIIILKTEITKTLVVTKDDTSQDGWKIRIVIDPTTITITHIRKELPLATGKPDEKQFWFRWELDMVFDRTMNEMLSASLRITELHFDEGLNPALKATLSTILNNGNMVIE